MGATWNMYSLNDTDRSRFKGENLISNNGVGALDNQAIAAIVRDPVEEEKGSSKKGAFRQSVVFVRAFQLVAVLVVLGVWQALANFHTINTFLYGSPTGVWAAFNSLSSGGTLISDILTTLEETIIGFVVGSLSGSLLALVLWFTPLAERIIKPFAVAFNGIPKIALAPLLIVWFGAGASSKIALALASTFIVSLITTYQGAYQVDPDLLALFRSYDAKRIAVMRWLVAPSAIPWAISALKINVGLALVGAVAGEFISSKRGLGHLVFVAGNLFETDVVLAGLFLLTVLAFLMYGGVALIEQIATRHLHT